MTLDNIIEEIKKAETIVILTHENPDGDAIGSSFAMYLALKKLGKNADVVMEEYSETFKFLPGSESVKTKTDVERYDLAIALDCADLKRLNGFGTYFEKARVKVVIDHHGSNKMFGDINFVNPVSPACCEILAGIFEYFGITIDQDIGTCLLAGIITDTGGFKYSGVTAETFEFTADLLRKGVNVSETYKKVLQMKTKANFELQKLIMERMEFLEDGKITFTYMTKEDEERVNAKTGDHEGLVELGRDVEGVEVSIFLREREDKTGFKASLRSNNKVNVSDVCLMFGGGGHVRAAGCNLSGTLEQAKTKIVNEVKKVI